VTRLRLRRISWIAAAAILVAAALVALGSVLRGDFSDTDGRVLVTLAAVLYAGGAALAGLALAERGPARALGRTVAVSAPVALGLILGAVWSFAFDGGGNETADKLAWSSVLALLAGLIATTALLLARRREFVLLAAAAAGLAALAAVLSIAGVWSADSSDLLVKALAAFWILAALCYFLVPVLQRFIAADAAPSDTRVLASLGDVELVATRSGGVDARLEPGERLLLRRRG
jgi:hypothetical protein